MRLDEYQWSRNPRGLHAFGAFIRPDLVRYTTPRFGWAKLVADNVEHIEICTTMIAAGITPIIRVYLTPQQNVDPLSQQAFDMVTTYAALGVKWFELYNEPNLPIEWPGGTNVDYRNTPLVNMLVDRWIPWAEHVVRLGCYPGFISLAETDSPPLATVWWFDAIFNYISAVYHQRFTALLASGMYYATHPYVLNHYYQEVPGGGPLSARPNDGLNSQEPGWHFEYPFDPICQSTDPGRTVYGGTPQTPNGDPVGLIATGQFLNERSTALFGTQAVPVLGTEGGIDLPFEPSEVIQRDTRYPGVTQLSNGVGTVAMFDWIATSSPPWFFGVCIWKEDDYYGRGGHALEGLVRYPPILKEVPPIDVIGTGTFTIAPFIPPAGPGPIHGEPTYHMVVLAPGLDPSWFFDTAFAYWSAFRPIVTTVTDFVNYVPYAYSLATTVIATPDTADMLRQLISEPYPNILFDLIIATGDLDSVAQVLNDRVTRSAPFG